MFDVQITDTVCLSWLDPDWQKPDQNTERTIPVHEVEA